MIKSKEQIPKLVSKISELKQRRRNGNSTTVKNSNQKRSSNIAVATSKNASMHMPIAKKLKQIAQENEESKTKNEKDEQSTGVRPFHSEAYLISKLALGMDIVYPVSEIPSRINWNANWTQNEKLWNLLEQYAKWYFYQKEQIFAENTPRLPEYLAEFLTQNKLRIKFRTKEEDKELIKDFDDYDHQVTQLLIEYYRPPFNDCFQKEDRSSKFIVDITRNTTIMTTQSTNTILAQTDVPYLTLIPLNKTGSLWRLSFKLTATVTFYEKKPSVPLSLIRFPFYQMLPKVTRTIDIKSDLLIVFKTEQILNLFRKPIQSLVLSKDINFQKVETCDLINL